MTDIFCKVFLYATMEISKQKVPLIHQVIPYFDSITTALEDNMDQTALPLVVRHAALRGYLMVNKYYTMTDASVVYRVAMSMFSVALSCSTHHSFHSPAPSLQDYIFHPR
jgi:hypothetical protein